jgi:hypothetical protein
MQSEAARPLGEPQNERITDSEAQAVLQAVLASNRRLQYDFESPMANEDGIVLDYTNATQTTEEYVQTVCSIVED